MSPIVVRSERVVDPEENDSPLGSDEEYVEQEIELSDFETDSEDERLAAEEERLVDEKLAMAEQKATTTAMNTVVDDENEALFAADFVEHELSDDEEDFTFSKQMKEEKKQKDESKQLFNDFSRKKSFTDSSSPPQSPLRIESKTSEAKDEEEKEVFSDGWEPTLSDEDGEDVEDDDDQSISFGDDSMDMLGLNSPMNFREGKKALPTTTEEDKDSDDSDDSNDDVDLDNMTEEELRKVIASSTNLEEDVEEFEEKEEEVDLDEYVGEIPPSPDPEQMEEIIDEGGNALDVEESYEDDATFEFITDSRTIKNGGVVNA